MPVKPSALIVALLAQEQPTRDRMLQATLEEWHLE